MFIARPTSGGTVFLLLTLAAGGVAFMNVGLMTALCAAILAAVWLSSFILAQFFSGRISVERLSAADVPGNTDAVLPLRITNNSIFYRQVMIIREKIGFSLKKTGSWPVPALAPGESIVMFRKIHADIRGHYTLEKLSVISGDPCGFFRRSKNFFLPGEITITPGITELEHLPVSRRSRPSDGGEGRLLGYAGIGGDFFGIRPYRYGDEIQHIYWRGSAARNKLMVKEFEASVTEKIHILLDCCSKGVGQDDVDSNFEHLVSAAASISITLSRRYCQLSFAAEFAEGGRLHLSGDASGICGKIIEALTELRCCDTEVDGLLCDAMEHLNPGDTLFLLTMSSSELTVELVKQLNDSGVLVNWIYAPAYNFPPVEPDIIRELPRNFAERSCSMEQIVLNFKSSLPEMLHYDNDLEKV
ncbi:MAG: DUF58 domain-containing protein [Lentisphaeria bacterium]|nr:DUF58 domain-containing protein [Lentisphaeria bacterium]